MPNDIDSPFTGDAASPRDRDLLFTQNENIRPVVVENPLSDQGLKIAILKREQEIRDDLRFLSRRRFERQVSRLREEQARSVLQHLLAAEADVARYRIELLIDASKRAAYLNYVQTERHVMALILRHETDLSDQLTALYFAAESKRDLDEHGEIAAVKSRQAKGILTDAKATRRIEKIEAMRERQSTRTEETMDRLLNDHRRFLAGVQQTLAGNFAR